MAIGLNSRRRMAICWLMPLGLAFVGCGGSNPPAKPSGGVPQDQQPDPAKTSAGKPAVSPTDTDPPAPTGPVESVRTMVRGLREHQPVVIWQAMPAGFRNETEELIHEFADRVDPVVWQRSFVAWQKVARLLSERSDDLVAYPAWNSLPTTDKERLRRRLADFGELLGLIAGSEIADIDRLKSLRVERFLQNTGGPMLQRVGGLLQALGESSLPVLLSELEPRLLEENADTARVGWFVKGKPTPASEFMMVKVDKSWVPAGWAASWDSVREIRQSWKAGATSEFFSNPEQRLQVIGNVDRVLTVLLATKTAGELHAALDREVPAELREQWIAFAGSLAEIDAEAVTVRPDVPPAGDATDADYVTVIVRGRIVPAAEDAVLTALEAAVSGDADSFPRREGDEFHVRIGPVADVSAFASRIRLGNVAVVDAEGRRVVIDLPM